MTKILVLLSTWNGERYLPAQIASLLAQRVPGDLLILIRDDGSSDDTVGLIQRLDDPRIRLVEGNNLGPRGSFLALLRMAQQEGADFVSLCDQDDVWDPDKLGRAISMLGSEQPGLYSSSLNLVDDNLEPIGVFAHPGNRSFVSTLLCNYVTGCTCVMNGRFIEQLPFPENADQIIMHDWWLASIATLRGQVVYDRQSFIGYRQHAANHVGIKTGIGKVFAKLQSVSGRPLTSRFDQARELLRSAEDHLSPGQKKTLFAFLKGEGSWSQRLRFVLARRTGIGLARILLFVAVG